VDSLLSVNRREKRRFNKGDYSVLGSFGCRFFPAEGSFDIDLIMDGLTDKKVHPDFLSASNSSELGMGLKLSFILLNRSFSYCASAVPIINLIPPFATFEITTLKSNSSESR
jgi:hypothetical protein